jgi:hypothetical protein
VSSAATTLCVASRRLFIVVVYFIIDSVRKLLDTPSYQSTASRTALGPTKPPIQWVPRALSLGVKRLGREADHSPPSSSRSKTEWSYTSTPLIRLHGMVLS